MFLSNMSMMPFFAFLGFDLRGLPAYSRRPNKSVFLPRKYVFCFLNIVLFIHVVYEHGMV